MEERLFTKLYLGNYARLLRIAYVYIPNHEDAENIVHDVFTTLWENRANLLEMDGITYYMVTMLKNRCLDFLKHQAHVADHAEQAVSDYQRDMQDRIISLSFYDPASTYDNEIIHNAVKKAIASLPTRCRQIYLLSRQEGLRNSDVAKQLNISQNTVEAQITIAHKKLREALKDYLPKKN